MGLLRVVSIQVYWTTLADQTNEFIDLDDPVSTTFRGYWFSKNAQSL